MVYGQPHPVHLPYLPGDCVVDAVDRSLQRRELMINLLKHHLQRAQDRMKHQADKHRSERSFQVNDWVWLKLQPYRQVSVQTRSNHKLSPKYYGPFQVLAAVGKVAYKLKLPVESKIHDVFHVSQLKAFHGVLPLATHIPTWFQGQDSSVVINPTSILDRRFVQVQNQAQVQYLVKWHNLPSHEANWEIAEDFEA